MYRLSVVLGLVVACLLLLAGCDNPSGEVRAQGTNNGRKDTRVKVVVTTVEPTLIRDILILPGETKPWKDVSLSADHGGWVDWVGFEEGDEVKKDDLLVKVDSAALKATLENAEANSKLAVEHFQRRKQLFERNIIGKEELDQSRNQNLVMAGILRQARVNYDRGFIRSPIDGLINRLYVDPGEFVGQGGKVADIVNIDKIQIDVNVPELDVKYIKVDDQCLVTVDAFPEAKILGRVDFVAFKADPATRTFRVKVLIDNEKREIRPGMITRIYFQKRLIEDALVAPLFSLVDRGGERLLYVEKDGVAHARTVEIGVIEGDKVQITKGLEIGDKLIVTGQNNVQEGVKVLVQ